ncbi:MAG: aminotransferase class I/II-fold pyridoxal phosphate-dependent enzyme [Coprobacillus cateniformis]
MPTLDDFKNTIKNNTKMICLNSPNNPTGTTISWN